MAVLSRAEILARKVHGTTEHVDLGNGDEVVVRGLTRGESQELSKHQDDFVYVEVQALAWGLVEPAMTYADVQAWCEGDQSGTLHLVVTKIQELSGTLPGQGKDATKSVSGRGGDGG
jgi:hypothetical protein